LKKAIIKLSLLLFLLAHLPSVVFAAGLLSNVTVIPQSDRVNDFTVYTLRFTTASDGAWPNNGKIEIKFNKVNNEVGFNLNNVFMASFGSANAAAGAGGFSSITKSDYSLYLQRDSKGIEIPISTEVEINVALIRNPSIRLYDTDEQSKITIILKQGDDTDISQGSDNVNIFGPIDSFIFNPAAPASVVAGKYFDLGVSNADDGSGGRASGWVFVSIEGDDGISPNGREPDLNPIYVSGDSSASPVAQKLVEADESVQLRGISGAASTLTDPFVVQHAVLDTFQLFGVPSAIQTGQPFPDSVIVVALDSLGNRARTYDGTVHFASFDLAAVLPADYTFDPTTDRGRAAFSGSSFVLQALGNQTLQVSDHPANLVTTKKIVDVRTTPPYTYSLSITLPVVAGQPATVTVSDFKLGDITSDGTVQLSLQGGLEAHASPNGTLPVLNDIVVSNGSGSANIVLYKRESSVVLSASAYAAETKTLTFAVDPGDLNAFSMTGLPTEATAGTSFGSLVLVTITALDRWGNIKTNFEEDVDFSTGDIIDVLPGPRLVKGQVTINGSNFTLKRAGVRTITVSDRASISTASPPILVHPAAIAQFTVPASLNATAGAQFALPATNVIDAYGNLTTGTIAVTAVSGAGNSPNGQAAIINDINAKELGTGTSSQVLVLARPASAPAVLRCQAGSTFHDVNVVVSPGPLARLALSGVPGQAVIDQPLSGTIVVALFDGFGNSKTDYLGNLVFSSATDIGASLPGSTAVSGASKSFSGDDFTFHTAGMQTFTVTDQSAGLSVTSAPISVNAVFVRSVSSLRTQVGQGQTNIRVTMQVQNMGTEAFLIEKAELKFTEDHLLEPKLDDDYSFTFLDAGQSIPPGTTVTLDFDVTVTDDAKTCDVVVGGTLYGKYGSLVSPELKASLMHTWQVFGKAVLDVESIDVKADTIYQGQSNIEIELRVGNIGTAENGAVADALVANSSDFNPFMWTSGGTTLPPATYTVRMQSEQNTLISAGALRSLLFDLTVPPDAPEGEIVVQTDFPYTDAVSGMVRSAGTFAGDDESDRFWVEPRNLIELVSITPSQSLVTRNQTEPWTVEVAVRNSGPTPVAIDFNPGRTFIEFRSGPSADPGFAVIYPTSFGDGSDTIDSGEIKEIVYTVATTSPLAGVYGIWATVQTVSGVISTSLSSNIVGTVEVLTEDNLRFVSIQPSQPSITLGAEDYEWTVTVVLRNQGGTEVQIDFDSLALDLPIAEFSYLTPSAFSSGGSTLKAGQQDTLHFFPVKSLLFAEQTGERRIGCRVVYRVMTTGQVKSITASEAVKGVVLVQTPARLSIVNVHPSRPIVTAGAVPNWHVELVLQNSGGADIRIDADSTYTRPYFFDTEFAVAQDINFRPAPGELILPANSTGSLIFPIESIGMNVEPLIDVRAKVRGWEINRNVALQDTALTEAQAGILQVQLPPEITYLPGSLQPTYVGLGTFVKFQVDVQNLGGSTVVLTPIQSRIRFVEHNFSATLDDGFSTTIPPGDPVRLYFNVNQIQPDFPPGNYTPQLTFNGTENDNPFAAVLTLSDNLVTVGDAGELSIQAVRPSVSVVTAGQTVPWWIDIEVMNNGVNPLDLQNVQLEFFSLVTEQATSAFTFVVVDTFLSGGSRLAGNESAILRIPITAVSESAPEGKILVNARIDMIDAVQTTRQVNARTDQGTAGFITVQGSAQLVLTQISASQTTVTRGQEKPWTVSVTVQNSGGSALSFPVDTLKNRLDFSAGNAFFAYSLPAAPLLLAPGASDEFVFTITRIDTNAQLLGSCSITATLTAQEVTSGREYTVTRLANGDSAFVQVFIQDNARARIDSLQAVVARPNFVSGGQAFYVRAKISNPVSAEHGDLLQSVAVSLVSENPELLMVAADSIVNLTAIPAGESQWTNPGFLVQTREILSPAEEFTSHLTVELQDALNRNTGEPAMIDAALVDTLTMAAQLPAKVVIDSLKTSLSVIPASYLEPWTIAASVRNTGTAPLLLTEPKIADVEFSQRGYVVEPPVLSAEERLLLAGEERKLIYTVTATTQYGGKTTITVQLAGTDQNDPQKAPSTDTLSVDVMVETNAAVRLVQTFIDPQRFNVLPGEIGAVNVGQDFQIGVTVQNEGGQRLNSVQLQLQGQRSRIIHPDTVVYDFLNGEKRTIWFDVQTDNVENLTQGETFRAAILQARGIDGTTARINPADDSTAFIKIFSPAEVVIVQTEVGAPRQTTVSTGQVFPVQVKLTNLQSEMVRDVRVKLSADPDSLVVVADSLLTIEPHFSRGDTQMVEFTITAGNRSGHVDFLAQIDAAIGANSGVPATIVDAGDKDSTAVIIQQGAQLQVLSATPSLSPAEISAGDSRNPWQLYVQVRNQGGADLELIDIGAENVRFTTDGQIDPDYEVRPPLKLRRASADQPFVLPAAVEIDTLVYVISTNGKIAGSSAIEINLRAVDRNLGRTSAVQTGKASAAVFVKNRAWVRVKNVWVTTPVTSPDGANHVNRGQMVKLTVALETGELAGVDEVIYELRSDGNSLGVGPTVRTIDTIASETTVEQSFDFQADNSWPLAQGEKMERLTARILSARAQGSALSAQIRASLDSTATLRIQRPATLSLAFLTTDTLVTLDQQFTVRSRIQNLGTALYDSGRVRLIPAAGYQIQVGQELFTQDPVEKRFIYSPNGTVDLAFVLKAPSTPSENDVLRLELSSVPTDLNSNALAVVEKGEDEIQVSTLSTTIQIDSTWVTLPAGARDGVLSTRQLFTVRTQFYASETMRELSARLELPTGLGYELRSPQSVELLSADRLVEWTVRAPDEQVDTAHRFTVTLEGLDLDERVAIKDTLELARVQKRASLLLEKLSVASPPGLVQDGIAVFSIGQEAKLRTRVINEGQAGVLGNVRVAIDFLSSGFRTKSGSEPLSKEGPIDTVFEWTVVAPDTATALREIRVAVTAIPNDENSGTPAETAQSPNELLVQTQRRGELSVQQIFISSPAGAKDSTLSTGQSFVIGAEISSDPDKVREGIVATIHFSSTEFLAAVRNVGVPVGANQTVTWAITAPQTPRLVADSLWITVVGYDKRSGAQLTTSSRSLHVRTEESAVFSLQPAIVFPTGLIDFISTDQEFHLAAIMEHEGANYKTNDKFSILLRKPADFQFKAGETFLKTDTNDTLIWRMLAPSQKPNGLSEFVFEVQSVPADVNTGQEARVQNRTVSFRLQTVAKSRLALRAYLDEEKNSIGTVRIGSSFDLRAELENLGDAECVGTFGARLLLGDSRFETSESLEKTIVGTLLSWRINAPVDIVGPDTIKVEITRIPLDRYSQQTAEVIEDTAQVIVSTESGMLIVRQTSTVTGSLVARGQSNRNLLEVEMQNQDIGSSTRTLLQGLKLTFRNKLGEPIPASSVVERVALYERGTPQTILAETRSIPDNRYVEIRFAAADTIRGTQKRELGIEVDIPADAANNEFSVALDSAVHVYAVDALSGYQVLIGDIEGNRMDYLNLHSGVCVIVDADLQKTFFNYPNPFGSSGRPNTRLVYALSEASDVEIKIFTLTGELVKSYYFDQEVDFQQTRAGLHENDVYWDGLNDHGMRVMNGIYLAYITAVNSGITAKSKIAVVK